MKNLIKLLCLMLAALMLVTVFAGCNKAPVEEGNDTDPVSDTAEAPAEENNYEKDKAEYDAMTAEQLVEKYVADPANITAKEYCSLIATYAFVPVAEDGEFETNNKTKDALDIVKDAGGKTPSGLEIEVASTMLAHPYDNARAYFYRFMASSTAGVGTDVYNALLAQYKNETDPFVIACMIYGISRSLGEDADYCSYVLSLAENEEYKIRYYIAMQLNYLVAADKEALVTAGLKLVADPEENVKNNAMKSCGKLGDERFVEPLSAVLKDMAQISSHPAAADGLISMWRGNISEAAYDATMEYFKAESTDPKYPDWTAVNALTMMMANEDEWLAEATYFDPAEVVEIMKGLVADAEAQKLTKTSAIKVIGKYGTTDDLNGLKAVVEASPDKDALIKEIDKQLAN